MQIQYEHLFKLGLKHGYFSEGNAPAIDIVPTAETSRIMQQLGIRMKAGDFGAQLYYAKGPTPGGQLLTTEAPVRLSFLLRSTDPLFLNYTDLPISMDSDSIRYLTNLSPQPNQPAGVFSVGDGEPLPLVSALFTIGVTPGARITVTDELGNELHTFQGQADAGEPTPSISVTKEDGSEIRVDLSRDPTGFYTLWEGEDIIQQFINAPRNWQAEGICLLSVYLGDTGTNGKHILIDGAVTPADFNLTFDARATKWRYHFIDSNNVGFSDLKLLDADSRLPIAPPPAGPVSKQLPDGSTAMVLTTPTTIPLRRRPGSRFLLSMKPTAPGNADAITIILPSADASRISRDNTRPSDASEDPEFYSDLYVYL